MKKNYISGTIGLYRLCPAFSLAPWEPRQEDLERCLGRRRGKAEHCCRGREEKLMNTHSLVCFNYVWCS